MAIKSTWGIKPNISLCFGKCRLSACWIQKVYGSCRLLGSENFFLQSPVKITAESVNSRLCTKVHTTLCVQIGGKSRIAYERVISRGQSNFWRYEHFSRWFSRFPQSGVFCDSNSDAALRPVKTGRKGWCLPGIRPPCYESQNDTTAIHKLAQRTRDPWPGVEHQVLNGDQLWREVREPSTQVIIKRGPDLQQQRTVMQKTLQTTQSSAASATCLQVPAYPDKVISSTNMWPMQSSDQANEAPGWVQTREPRSWGFLWDSG